VRRTLEFLEDGLHPAGVALVMCDRRILSSDPQDWDELISEAAGAEKYSRRLSVRITDGYAAKFDRHDDPGGHAGLGFRRMPDPPHTLEIDPATIVLAVGLFERHALGAVSARQLADETGLEASRIRVSDDLRARVEAVRQSRTRGGGPRHRGRQALLAGLLECSCGRRVRYDGRMGNTERIAKLHTDPCAAWGSKARISASTWEAPILAQLGSIKLDNSVRAQIVAVLSAGESPVTMDRARLERHLAEEKSDVIRALYERIVIEGPRFVGLRLTPAAYRHALALALPDAVMARPTGVGRALATYEIPIEGRDEWPAAAGLGA
jgi:hypothetical protein